MSRREPTVGPNAHLYFRESFYTLDNGRIIEAGEIIKIRGVNARKFRFYEYVRRIDTGAEWIECFEIYKGQNSGQYSFRCDRIKPLPKKRRRKAPVGVV